MFNANCSSFRIDPVVVFWLNKRPSHLPNSSFSIIPGRKFIYHAAGGLCLACHSSFNHLALSLCLKNRSLNMQQQMMPPSCQLDPNLLMKQQVPPSQQQFHQTAIKSFLENVVPHASQELQKGPSQISAFSNFPIGLNANLNVNMDMGSIKEPQSRLRKWTTVDSISANTSLDQNASKNGAISSGFRMEETPFVPYDFMSSSNSPASPPGSVGDGWPRAKSPNGSSSVNWPPGESLQRHTTSSPRLMIICLTTVWSYMASEWVLYSL